MQEFWFDEIGDIDGEYVLSIYLNREAKGEPGFLYLSQICTISVFVCLFTHHSSLFTLHSSLKIETEEKTRTGFLGFLFPRSQEDHELFSVKGEEWSILERFEGISNICSWILHSYVAVKDLSDDALFPYSKRLVKEGEQFLAEVKSVAKARKADLAEMKKSNKIMDDLMQKVTAQIAKVEIAKLEKLKKADRRYTVGTCCESQEESVWSFI
ncbi:uncharacterized protein LOC112089939 [Eutrema salsugineum]|uniref:uncharacterized protein LOC112089939 n=1 Tax=Eutrema salsugineum TaxID=72664 RepID=UPI000CECF5AF|nr:uncharacterized protein LOC112089939 [Eutrema salsugineum]